MTSVASPARADAAPNVLQTEIAQGITLAKIFVMIAALISLFIDQSFAGVFQAVQTYAGGTLGSSADELPWTTIGYSTLYWVAILLTPWLVDRFGRKPVFGYGHVIFGAISIYLATTASLHGFMLGRCFQGLAQGTFFVCSVATVLTLPPPKLIGYAFSIFSVTSLAGAASGSFIGGWFIDHATWRAAFVLYALFAIVAGVIIALLLEAPPPKPDAPRFDAPGIAFAFVAFFSFQYMAAFGERRDWFGSPDIVAFALLCVAGFAGFIWRELCEGRCGFIQLRLFNIRNLAVASVLGFGLGVPLFGGSIFLQYVQGALAFPPSTAGALLTLRIVAIVLVAPTAVLLINANKLDVRVPVVIGFILVSVSYGMLALTTTPQSDFTTFALAFVLSGAAFACLFSPIANVTVRSLPQDVRAEGIAIFKMVLLLGGAVAGSGLAVLYDHSLAGYQTLLAGQATLHHFGQAGVTPTRAQLSLVPQQASVLAYAANSQFVAVVSLVNLPFVFLLKKPPT